MKARRNKNSDNRRQQNQVRIIGGKWRGRKFSFPDAEGLRPTGDRVRETLFNWLTPYLPRAKVCDLFSGSGALGLEAASRGAELVVMVEKDANVLNHLRSSIKALDGQDIVKPIHNDAMSFLNKQESSIDPFDIIFLDPPFHQNLLNDAIKSIETNGWLNSDALIYIETCLEEAPPTTPGTWELHRSKTAGNVRFQLYRSIEGST